MISISFRANNIYTQPNNKSQNKQALSQNAQDILNKTNKYACGVNMVDSLSKPNKNVGEALKNSGMYLAMSSPLVNAIYTGTQIQKGNISKEEANKIFMYNMMCH